jgi:hypothetical protein
VITSATRSDGQPYGSPFSIGTTIVTWGASDIAGNMTTANQTVTVTGSGATVGAVTASPSVLWPPNHKMADITINYTTFAGCGGVNCAITSISSNEPVNGNGDGNTTPDWEIVDAHHVRVRSERAGNGGGRIYTITLSCTGAGGLVVTRTVTVSVTN